MRDRFTFQRHWMDGGDEMTEQERHEYLDAIVRYGLYGKRKAMSQYVRGRMVTVMREMDEDARREEAFREKQRRNGILGGRPKNPTKPNETQHNPTEPKKAIGYEPYNKESRVPARRQVYTDGISTPLCSVDIISSSSSSSTDNTGSGVAAAGGGRGGNSPFVSLWNEAIKAAGSPIRTIRSVTPGTKRHTLVLGLVQQYGEDGVREAIGRLLACDYTNGGSNIGWLPTFDWFVQPDNFQKVLEGNFFDGRAAPEPLPSPAPQEPTTPARPEVSEEDRQGWRQVLSLCRDTVEWKTWDTYLRYCDIWIREGDTVTMACPTTFVAEQIDRETAMHVLSAARKVWGRRCQMRLTVQRGLQPPELE